MIRAFIGAVVAAVAAFLINELTRKRTPQEWIPPNYGSFGLHKCKRCGAKKQEWQVYCGAACSARAEEMN